MTSATRIENLVLKTKDITSISFIGIIHSNHYTRVLDSCTTLMYHTHVLNSYYPQGIREFSVWLVINQPNSSIITVTFDNLYRFRAVSLVPHAGIFIEQPVKRLFLNDNNDVQGTNLKFIQNRFHKATIDLMHILTQGQFNGSFGVSVHDFPLAQSWSILATCIRSQCTVNM